MRDRTAKGGEAKPEKDPQNLKWRSGVTTGSLFGFGFDRHSPLPISLV
jgi:hypothetical protein